MASVITFPGQGAQSLGMGQTLFDKYTDEINQANKILGYSIEELCLHGPLSTLSSTEFTQPAIFVVSALSFLDKRKTLTRMPDYFAGHSLGEYNALFAAGAFDFETGLKLVKRRGELMRDAPKGAMAAVLNISVDRIIALLADSPFTDIDLANINSKQQCVISGSYSNIHNPELEQLFLEAGATFIILNVSAAFHSRSMKEAEKTFEVYLSQFQLAPLKTSVIANLTARPYPKANYQSLLAQQISHPVKWYESMSWLLTQGCNEFIEVGPGDVLTKLQRHIKEQPMALPSIPDVSKRRTLREQKPKVVFLFGGQGSQYFQMGRELFEQNAQFRTSMQQLNRQILQLTGRDILAAVYSHNAIGEFTDIRYTHPAVFILGLSLARMLASEGIQPDALVGHSLGEVIALVVAEVIDESDALRLILNQVDMVVQQPANGGMVSVMAPLSTMHNHPEKFSGVTLAGVNFQENFVVAGNQTALKKLQVELTSENTICSALPVSYAFHSEAVEAYAKQYKEQIAQLPIKLAKIPIYSSALAAPIGRAQLEDMPAYLWQIVRGQVNFHQLTTTYLTQIADALFIDLSATGSLANFLKYSNAGDFKIAYTLNRFGSDLQLVDKLKKDYQTHFSSA